MNKCSVQFPVQPCPFQKLSSLWHSNSCTPSASHIQNGLKVTTFGGSEPFKVGSYFWTDEIRAASDKCVVVAVRETGRMHL